jgi:hypothetical protein
MRRQGRTRCSSRQFEDDDDGGVCYIETLDHDTYTGHYRLRLIEFTPTRLAFEIARKDDKFVEVSFNLNAKRATGKTGKQTTSPRMMVILSNRGVRPCQTTKPAC